MALSKLESEWQRKLDPGNYAKARNAQYHTAPSVVPADSPDYPADAPAGSVTLLFFMKPECWLAGEGRFVVDEPTVVMKEAKGKTRFKPVVFKGPESVYAIMPASENYYYAAYELSLHEVVRCEFKTGRRREDGTRGPVVVTATFIP